MEHFSEVLRYKLEDCAFGGVIGIFERRDPSGRTGALVSTKTLREMRTRNISRRVKAAGA